MSQAYVWGLVILYNFVLHFLLDMVSHATLFGQMGPNSEKVPMERHSLVH